MIRNILLSLSVGFALASCGVSASVPQIPAAPVELADRTAADEQIAVGAENAYKAFRMALELAVDSGVLKGEAAAKAAKADQTAYTALLVMREAYKTANREDWINAARSANIALKQALATIRSL